jgi:hypothetical protein
MKFFLFFQEFYNFIENQFGFKFKTFKTDNGTEFVNEKISNFLKQKEFYTKLRMFTHHNKIIFQKEKIGIYLK